MGAGKQRRRSIGQRRRGSRSPGLAALVLIALTLGAAFLTYAAWDEDDPPPGATVETVVDGDTIVLAGGRRVRLAQIDAPELTEGECYAIEAQQTLADLLPAGTEVRLRRDRQLDDVDRFGRLIRYVLTENGNLNLELVRRGAASVWFVEGERGRHARTLDRAVRRARRSFRGFWRACPGVSLDTSHGVQTGPLPAPG